MKLISIIFSLLLILLLNSCSRKSNFQEEILISIKSLDRIEIKMLGEETKNSIWITDRAEITTLKEMIIPQNLEEVRLTDENVFSVNFLLYTKNNLVGEIGVEFGHIQYLYYKLDDKFKYKTEMNDHLGKFLMELKL